MADNRSDLQGAVASATDRPTVEPDRSPAGPTHAGPAHADDPALRESLAGVAALAVGDGEAGLATMLTHVAQFAVHAIAAADGAGLTLLEPDRADTIVATTDFVRTMDDIQYGLGQGPCISAATTGRTVRSGSLGTDHEWPEFGARVVRLGVHSALSVPLPGPDRVLGAVNIYAHACDAFDDRAAELAQLFAVPAAVAVANAQALMQAQRLASQLQSALNSRAVIDQAIGILMSRVGCDAAEAFDRLRGRSQADNKKLHVIASHMVDEAVRRARAHRIG